MSLRVYSTLSRQKELFEPVNPGKVNMYLCGPTVYKSPHIGHMVGPVLFDVIKRYLAFKGFEVRWIVNITDVEDKLIDVARRQNTTVQALAEKYAAEYFHCIRALGVDSIDEFPKASEHIREIIDICQKLIDNGTAYVVEGNVYFDVSKDADYGKLSHRRVEEQEAGTRTIEDPGKRNPADFALWKAAKPGEPSWDSPWGKGRPGWHIECSAMSLKCLGVPTLDIHGGGLDLLFPHHENELAQSESATGKPFVKYWLHNGLTKVRTKASGGEHFDKASGSLIEKQQQDAMAIDARRLIERHGADLLRYLLLTTHYRSPIEFTEEAMTAARKGLSVFKRLFERVERITGRSLPDKAIDMDQVSVALLDTPMAPFVRSILSLKMKFLEMMDDDFNTAGAIGVFHEMAGEINSFIEQQGIEKQAGGVGETSNEANPGKLPDKITALLAAVKSLRNLGKILGLFAGTERPPEAARDASLTDKLMALLIQLRQEARASKNFALSDAIRNRLMELGITLEDRPGGTGWRKD